MSFLSMGKETYKVPMESVFVANRANVVQRLGPTPRILFLKGGTAAERFDTDHEPIFRQESYFWYLTGVKEPDCHVAIDVPTGHTCLFIPKLPADYATVMGRIQQPAEWKETYIVDEVLYVDQVEEYLFSKVNGEIDDRRGTILLLKGINSDSGNLYEPPRDILETFASHVDTTTLFPILAECRVIKSSAELLLLQHVTEVTSYAHAYVMRNMKAYMMEYQAESLFRHYCYYNYGCRLVGYTPICGCGPNAATLHYGHAGEPNARQSQPGELCLFDMGAEYFGYGSDVTCSFPVSGVFSPRQTTIYNAVLNAQIAVYTMIRPHVSYVDCHVRAEEEIVKGLVQAGVIVPGDKSIQELVQMRMGAVFMPHGLGHLIGIDTHDVGGYLPGHPERSSLPGLKKLRTARLLKENMTLTVEPGCYFIDHLLEEALAEGSNLKPYLNESILNEYRGFGGIRLEDVIVVTESGMINYTLCPRTIAEVESVVSGGKWPPLKDEAKELRRLRLTEPNPLPSPPSF
jgi:Xaa-Pro dipeptidase